MKLIHKTNGNEVIISTKVDRLIPRSISCTKYGTTSWVEGKNSFVVDVKNDSKILNINIDTNFYKFGKEFDTPINRGKIIYRYAIKNNIDIIKIKNVPKVGTEYAILNINCIEKINKIKKIVKESLL